MVAANPQNLTLGFPNLIDTATLSGGAWTVGLPLANLQSRLIKKVARTPDATNASTQFKGYFASSEIVRAFALVNHNISFSGKWRITLYSDNAWTTQVYTSDWQYVWPFFYVPWDINLLEWELDTYWLANYTARQIAGATITSRWFIPDAQRVCLSWKIEVDDTTNTAGYVQIGRPFIGPTFQAVINYQADTAGGLKFESKTTTEESLDGTEYFEVREPYRVFNFTQGELSKLEGFGSALQIQRQANLSNEIFVIADPTDYGNAFIRDYMGRLRAMNPLYQPYWDTAGMAWEVKELR